MKPEIKKQIILHLPYLMFVYLFDKVAQAFRLAQGADLSAKLMNIGQGFSAAFANAAPSFNAMDLLIGVAGAVIIRLVIYSKQKNAKKYRKGMEYGTARWGTPADIKPFIDPVFENNVLLTQTERLMMSNRPKEPKNARNKNILVIGGSGSGKTRFFAKPNLMQLHSSYVITDPKGSILIECGQLLQRAKYKIKVLNTINFSKSMHYNPFSYLRSEKDILKLVNTIIVNTKGEGAQSGEDFWVKAERLYYTALIGYIYYEAPEEEKNIITLLDMINASDTREDDEDYKNPVDLMFDRLEEKDPEHFALKQYKKYKLAAGKTAKSILISCGARLAPFDIKELRDLMEYDEMELDTLGDRKTALFLIMSDTDSTFNFVIAILQSQLFNLLCDKADDVYGGRLPVHVRCILDEFANIGQIPQFDKLIATIRSREISASIILQSQSQLKAIYKDNADTIVGNCDTMLFLGGKEKTTLKEISEILGKETIDSFNTSENRGKEISHGLNYQKLGKELMTQDEIATMDGGMCILQVRGVRPFFSKKYDITQHPNYKYLSDADKKNAFDVERYIRAQRKKKHTPAVIAPEEVFDLYDIELPETDSHEAAEA
ncbi:MAG: type IV secretory system conjugative DNA transfer family protein [Oscillospiraceae bacterium]|nr:type IV secretory system conjugative DNA transfer family protein [Oscillospiraceae bacterium]